jgi:hypothetical protein
VPRPTICASVHEAAKQYVDLSVEKLTGFFTQNLGHAA